MSKDRDFRDSHLVTGVPRRLLVVATGNIANRELLALFDAHLDAIVSAFEQANLVELSANSLTILDD